MNAAPKRGRPPKRENPTYLDRGPEIRWQAMTGADAPRLMMCERPDPDRPMRDQGGVQVGYHMGYGACVEIHYDRLHREGFLSDAQREAADRYERRMREASGALEGRGESVRVQRGAPDYFPTERQVAAIADLRGVDDVLGVDAGLVRLVAGENKLPAEGLDVARFRTALQRAAEWWGMT